MKQRIMDELAALGRKLSGAGSRFAIWQEGSCAAKLDERRFLVSKAGERLDGLGPESFTELDLAEIAGLSAVDQVPDEATGELLSGITSDATIYALLLAADGVSFAIHTQPIEVNQILCSPRARQFADRRTSPWEVASCGAASLLVPYADPGLPRAREFRKRMHLWNDRHKVPPKVVLFHNYGMINLGATPEEIVESAEMTVKCAQVFIGAALMGGPTFLTPGNVSQIEAFQKG